MKESSNQSQANFWTGAGPTWKQMQVQIDTQINDHGLAAIDALDPRAGDLVLDIGSGTGTSSLQLADRVGPSGAVRGIDISSTMVAAAQERAAGKGANNVSFEVRDAQVEALGPVVDRAFSRFGVMFFANPVEAFTNIATALRPGAKMVFAAWQSPTRNPWASVPGAAVRRLLDLPSGGDPEAPGPFAFANPDRINAILSAAGFTSIDIAGREQQVKLGASIEQATEFTFQLMARGLAGNDDSDQPARVRAAVADALLPYATDQGIMVDSATWIVRAARQP